MKTILFSAVAAFLLAGSVAHAQTNPDPSRAVANGFVLQPRMETQQSLVGIAVASPGMMLGFRAGPLTAGLGVGVTALSASSNTANTDVSGSFFQLVPTVSYDVWQSLDGRARFNLIAAVGYGHANVSARDGADVDSVSATIIPIRAALGGDYFFHPNFGFGAEAGLQMFVLASAEVDDADQNVSFNSKATYGALRLTFIVGQ